jgi:hypothetical protein
MPSPLRPRDACVTGAAMVAVLGWTATTQHAASAAPSESLRARRDEAIVVAAPLLARLGAGEKRRMQMIEFGAALQLLEGGVTDERDVNPHCTITPGGPRLRASAPRCCSARTWSVGTTGEVLLLASG